jgi:hypothetical protein
VTFKVGKSVRLTLGIVKLELNVIVTLPSSVTFVMLAVITFLGATVSTATIGVVSLSHLNVNTILYLALLPWLSESSIKTVSFLG